jgi:lantibiotic modifying enzyme
MSGEGGFDPAPALEVAAQIGFGIARRAFRHGGRCTWLEGVPVPEGQNPAVSATAGADLYGGVAGIGAFMAEAARRTGDFLLRETALGALRQAEAKAGELLGLAPHGFYGGAAGVGWALVSAGLALDDEASVAAGRLLLLDVPTGTDAPFATDMISGLAGTAVALALAGDALGEADLVARAGEAARNLVAQAVAGPDGCLSWATMDGVRANLTGFAHGAAGIAHALLLVDALTPDAALRDAAEAALRYEDQAFNPEAGGWPDYRAFAGTADQLFHPVAWCHGASGILQSRLPVAASLGRGRDVVAGLAATIAEAQRMLAAPNADFTLCHGATGLADALLDTARSGYPEATAAVVAAANFGWQNFHAAERPWPSGLLNREETSGLMLGNAGIGWFYLRLADPALGSLLVPGAARLAAAQPMSPSPA